MNAHTFPRHGALVAFPPRQLDYLHRDGAIRFRAVLRLARTVRRQHRKDERQPRDRGSCLIRRFDRVRFGMADVRRRVDRDRVVWLAENGRVQPVRQNPEDAWDFAWSRRALP